MLLVFSDPDRLQARRSIRYHLETFGIAAVYFSHLTPPADG
jgi:hypothetical protein